MRNTPSSEKNVHQQFADYFPSVPARPYLYLLSKKLAEGHICIRPDEIKKTDLDDHYTIHQPISLQESLVSDGTSPQPMVLYNDHLYFHRYFVYESSIIDKLKALLETSQTELEKRVDQLVTHENVVHSLLNTQSDEPDWQSVAALLGYLHQFTIITGGPGTGKTTTVSKLLQLMFSLDPQIKVAMAAPTGKAAARMAESIQNNPQFERNNLDLTPFTIHRLLGFIKNSIYFKHNESNPLPYDVVVVDESSMIDVALFAKLIQAIGPQTRLIMLGDKNQLASVEAGSLFGDLCSIPEQLNHFSKPITDSLNKIFNHKLLPPGGENLNPLCDHIVELQRSYRFSDDEGIGKFSRIVLKGDLDAFDRFVESGDAIVSFDFDYTEKKFNDFVSLFDAYIKCDDIAEAIKTFNQARMLCALRDGSFGFYETNTRVEKQLEKRGLIKRTREFYEHRPIMITRNDYVLGLNNGDTGIIRKDEKGFLKAWFEIKGELTAFNPSLLNFTETAFCVTIHKSQGSEFDEVLILLPDFEVPVLTKELIYTAVTRAKEKVLIQADKQILKQAILHTIERGSGVQSRL